MRIRNLLAGALSAGVALASTSAFAAAWVMPSGSNSNYSYAGGGDDNGLFGEPSVEANGFSFVPNNFVATSTGGVTTEDSIVTDRLYVTVATKDGSKSINKVNLGEVGDYSIDNGGGVKAFAYLVVRVLDETYAGASRVFSATMATTPGFPLSTAGDAGGEWTGLASVNLPFPASRLQIVLNNTLQANSSPNGSAFIQKKLLANGNEPGLQFIFNEVPEPTSITMVVAGLGVLAARRRKA